MKNSIFKGRKAGFTLVELLMVIAILVILIGLGVTGFLALRRNIQIAKYDDLAREIYVAAQNQLTRLEANGMDKETADTLSGADPVANQPEDYTPGDWGSVKANYRHANQDDAKVMELLLPLGAVADDVRSNGFYVVEYNVKTNTVYGVFYSEKTIDYPTVAAGSFRTDRDSRKTPMVGYYGGSSVERDAQIRCEVPKLEIMNNNELRLNILEVPTDVKVSVTVSDGVEGHKPYPVDWIQDDGLQKKTVLLDGMNEKEHFYELFKGIPTVGISALTPGKDLTITVTYSKDGAISSSASITANSLFATREPGGQQSGGSVNLENPGDVVTIAWARHLQNLESTVSGLNDPDIAIARQIEHIQWNDGFSMPFISIENKNANAKLLRYEGSRLEIRNLTGVNGLFAETKEKMELSGIRIVNPVIDNTNGQTSVGALVGTAAQDTLIEFCAVYSSKIKDDGTVDYPAYDQCYVNGKGAITGGLAGTATNTEVRESFAALPSITGQGATLIGSATNCDIGNSYANCDNLPKEHFAYFLNGDGNEITHCYAVGNVANDNDQEGIFAAGTGNTVEDSYYAVSHRKFAPDPKNNQDLAATEFRYTADGEWITTNQEGMEKENPLGTDWDTMIPPLTHPYREYLDGRAYPYPAIGHLDHYGSWPDGDGTVDLKITMQLPNDKTVDYAIFAGWVQVVNKYELDENGNPVLLFDSEKHTKLDGTFDGEDTVKVVPGTRVQFTIQAAKGYEYLGTDIGKVFDARTFEYEVRTDTEAIVQFQQKSHTLKCLYPVGDDNKTLEQATYVADCGLVALLPPHQTKVETGSDVVVRITSTPAGYPNGKQVVWFTRADENHSKRHEVQEDIDKGTYSFKMPGADTQIHVKYTKDTANFKVEYYLMDANQVEENGDYSFVPQVKLNKNLQYGIGTDINQQLIKILADSSNLPVTLERENVLFLEKAEVTKGTETVFRSISDQTGAVEYLPTVPDDPGSVKQEYSTTAADKDQDFTIRIYIARATYELTLTKGMNIERVSFGDEIPGKPSEDGKSISYTFRYGQSVEAHADVIPGQVFTVWDSSDSRFRKSSASRYSFTMPHYDLTLTAMAEKGNYLVSLELRENGDSWLASSASRKADPVTVYLVNSVNASVKIPMESLTQEDNSFLVQKIVPAIPDLGQGYYILVEYQSGLSEFYTTGGAYYDDQANDDRVMLTVRDGAVDAVINFYSVTYHTNCEKYVGSVPTGGTYLDNHRLTVAGNPGFLRNLDEKKDDKNQVMKILTGWRNVYAGVEDGDKVYGSGERLSITHETDLFAEWAGSIRVYYEAPEATGGSLPVDPNHYRDGELVTVKAGVPERAGYTFTGWMSSDNQSIYHGDEQFTIGSQDITLTAQWEAEQYTLTYWELQEGEWRQVGDPQENLLYGVKLKAAKVDILNNQADFLGWATSVNGEVLYRAEDEITITGDMQLYARTSGRMITVTYYSMDGDQYGEQEFGMGVSAYLTPPETAPAEVTAWSTEKGGKGRLYLCQDGTNRSQDPAAFAANTDLYAVSGRVYNVNQQTWYHTLYDAVNAGETTDGNTLIVYRSTEETERIEFIHDNLYILANGNRTVTWKEESKSKVDIHTGNNENTEFTGCMKVGKGRTITFGDSNIETISMEGNTLTFNASKLGRVIALQENCVFNMYDGVTLTNGELPYNDQSTWWQSQHVNGGGSVGSDNIHIVRSHMGGGVYAGAGSRFNMYGGTISYCSAICGGGVYLYTGSKMQMGNMEQPTYYSSTATYYYKINEKDYENVQTPVGPENYKDNKYVVTGNPVICYNTATRKFNEDFSHSDGGGGVLMLDLNDGDLILYSGSIYNNSTTANGGGIMTDAGPAGDKGQANKAKLRIYEVDISHNSAGGFGGGIFQWQGVLHVYNSTLRQNHAEKDGGGIYLHHYNNTEKSNIEFWHGDISGNRAGERGGGVYVENNLEMKIYSGHLYNNTAVIEGGGVYLENVKNIGGKLYLSSGSIENNRVGNWTNDVFLGGSSNMTAMKGGLSFQQSGAIHVDCENPPVPDASNLNPTRLMVGYEEDTSFKGEDADYFLYDPKAGVTNDLIVRPSDEKNLVLGTDPKKQRSITFHANYIPDGQEQEETYPVGDVHVNTLIEYHSFSRPGYDLIGWATAPDATIEEYLVYRVKGVWYTKYENGAWLGPLEEGKQPEYTVTEGFDQQLYAMWKPYTVTYHLMTDNPDVTISQEESVGPNIRILFPTNQYTEGEIMYTFIGWSMEENRKEPTYVEDGEEITLTESLDLYAVWQPDKVNITFDFNEGMLVGGELSQKQLVPREQDLTIPELSITRTNFIHTGWSKNQDSQMADYPIKEGIVLAADLKEDLTLYAVWADAVPVTFDCNGGESDGSEKLEKLIEKGKQITLDVTPTRLNYDFLGWAETKEATEAKYEAGGQFGPVNDKATLYAVWRAKVPVKLMMNDGTGATVSDTMESVGGQYTLGAPMRPGYKFLGWAKNAGDDTIAYKAEEIITIPAEEITLYAVWAEGVTIKLYWNITEGAYEDEVILIGTSFTLPAPEGEREGYVFQGWSTNSDGSDTLLQPGGTMTPSDDTTLYAIWEPAESTEATPPETKAEPMEAAKPKTEEQPAEATKPATEEQPAEATKPTAEEQPAEATKPATEEQSTEATKPAAEEKPTETTKPTAEEKPTETTKPATEEQSTEATKPAADTKPTEATKPTTEEQPTEATKPAAEEKPTETTKPVTEEKPTETTKPAAEEKPTETTKPAAEEKPTEVTKSAADTKPTEAIQPATEAKPTEAPTEAETVPSEEEYTVTFYLEGGKLKKHAKLSDKELEDYEWDKKEKKYVYTVPTGKNVKVLPPEVVREGYFCDGWTWKDGEEEKKYPADKEIPVEEAMELRPIWKKVKLPRPTAATAPKPNPAPAEAATPPATAPKPTEAPATETKPTEPAPTAAATKPTEPAPTAAATKPTEPAPTAAATKPTEPAPTAAATKPTEPAPTATEASPPPREREERAAPEEETSAP